MSQFFTIVSDGAGNPMYFNEEQRKQIINKNLFDKNGNRISDTDSHSSIMAYNGIFGNEEDWYNKYEYNPFTKILTKDAINNKDDSDMVKKFCDNLDFKTIVPELIIENIVNPKDIVHGDKVSEHEIELLHMWTSVEGSVEGSVGHSVRDSVRDSVFNSVWDSVFNSVWNSVWDSVIVYISSFFMIENWKYINHEEGKNPFQPCIDLWNLGLVPSFDGTTWRLHKMCDNAKVIYEWKK